MGKSSSAETAATIQRLLIEKDDLRADAARLDELRRVLAGLDLREFFDGPTSSTVHQQWTAFLRQSRSELVRQLVERIVEPRRLPLAACRTLWGVIATSPAEATTSNGRPYHLVDASLVQHFVRAVATADDHLDLHDKQLRLVLESEFLGPYRDVQYYFILAIVTIVNELLLQNKKSTSDNDNEKANQVAAERLADMLQMIPLAKNQEELDAISSSSAANSGYLFPPPSDIVPDNNDNDDGEESGSDSEDEEELESEDETSSSDDEDGENRPRKRVKTEKKIRFPFESLRQHRSAWTQAWLAVLRLPMSESTLKQILRFLPVSVLPISSTPLRFADFFMNAYSSSSSESGGAVVVPMLALEGLFLLMTRHGLEYPNFYKQLYKLIASPRVLLVKHRTKFCRLLDKCLSRNDMLPAHVVAAFVKRLLRSSLTAAPPASCLFCLALCSNLLRRHPETACLVHRHRNSKRASADEDGDSSGSDSDSDDEAAAALADGFDATTDDPEQANALQSSLWELGALERHYYPAVVTLAQAVGRKDELQTPMHNLEDFLSLTYATLFEQERNKRSKRGKNSSNNSRSSSSSSRTPLTFTQPGSVFSEDDVFAGILALPK